MFMFRKFIKLLRLSMKYRNEFAKYFPPLSYIIGSQSTSRQKHN